MSKSIRRMNKQAVILSTASKKRSKRQMQAVIAPTNRPPTTRSLDRRLKRIQNREELKHIDKLLALEMVNNTGASTMSLLNNLSQGVTNITRIADRATFTSIQIRAIISFDPALLTNSANWRVIVFRDLQPNGAACLLENILDLSVITAPIYAPYNNDYTERFRIISDKRGVVNPNHLQVWNDVAGVNTGASKGVVSVKYNFRWQLGFITNYGLGNAGTIADISKNAVYICALSDQTIASTFGPQFTGGSRMYFKDD